MTVKKQKKRLFKKKVNNQKVVSKKQNAQPPPDTFFRRHEKSLVLILIPLILFVIYILTLTLSLKIIGSNTNIKTAKSINVDVADYPLVEAPISPILSARSAIIIEADTKKEIFSKNPEIRFSMASTTKIMTALVALDYYQLNSVLTIRSEDIEGSSIGLLPGEQYFFEDLLQAMMLPSANDAAVAIVDNYPGGRSAFIAAMNERARNLHLNDTSFSDPAGLDDDGNFTTVEDLARLGAIATKNEKLAEVASAKEKIITDITGTRVFELENLNQLLGFYGVNGIKTGTTEGAGEVLVTSAVIDGHTFIIVVMNSTDRFADTRALLSAINQNVRFVPISSYEN